MKEGGGRTGRHKSVLLCSDPLPRLRPCGPQKGPQDQAKGPYSHTKERTGCQEAGGGGWEEGFLLY